MIAAYRKHEQFLVAVDCIIFGFDGEKLKALLIHRSFQPQKGKWSLMGGFVNANESVDEAAKRILFQLTGLDHTYMEQLYCFGETDRDDGGRVISIAYFALIKSDDYDGVLMSKYHTQWFDLNAVPDLIFDHKRMLKMAKEKLQQKASNHPVGFSLLPAQFTLPQLQALYEAIYEVSLDKRNFAKKLLSLNILKKLDKKEKQSSRKGAFYYVFDKKKYAELERSGIKLM